MKPKSGRGSYHLFRRKRIAKGGFYPHWFAFIRFSGAESVKNTGFTLCPACLAAVENPRECKRCRTQAERWCDALLARMTDDWRAGMVAEVDRTPAPVPTIGEFIATYRAHWSSALDNEQCSRRNTTDLMLVLAYALDLWAVKVAGIGPRGVAVGDRYPDETRIGALSMSVLNEATARAYFTNRCASLGITAKWARASARAEYGTMNSTLKHARDMLSPTAREHVFSGRLVLPDLSGWEKFGLLPVAKSEPEPITAPAFERLVDAAEMLRDSEPDLWLLSRVARQTGLRCGSLRDLAADWVLPMHGGWRLLVKENKTAKYAVPIQAELAALIQSRPGLTFGDDEAARARLVNARHNDLLKRTVGEPARGSQKAHRLRDTLAGALYGWMGADAARMALGHEDVRTTLKHYARVPFEASDLMRREFAAFLPV